MSPRPPPPSGIAGMVLLFCLAFGGAGLALDFALDAPGPTWLMTQPGARALLGAAVALILLGAVYLLRLLLGRREPEEGGDA